MATLRIMLSSLGLQAAPPGPDGTHGGFTPIAPSSDPAAADTNGRGQIEVVSVVPSRDVPAIGSKDRALSPPAEEEQESIVPDPSLDIVPSLLPDERLPHALHRVLGWKSLTSMGVGATIGAGIFIMTGVVAREVAGPALSLSFVMAAIACGFTGLCYAEFAALAPSAGSAYAYSRATMGQFAAWCLGWDLILEYTVAAAAVAQGWSQYLNELLGLFGARIPPAISLPPFAFNTATNTMHSSAGILDLPAMLVSLLVCALLVCGVRDSARVNNVMVGIKVFCVLFVIVLGAFLVDVSNWSPFAPFGYAGVQFFGVPVPGQIKGEKGGAGGMLAGAALVFFAYIGFDSVSCHAEEARKPERTLPIAILLSLTISTALYVAVALVITGMVNYKTIDVSAPLSTAFSQRGYAWAAYLIALGAVVGMSSVLLVSMLSQPRIYLAMARDGLLPKFFSDVHPRFKTPFKGTILTGIVVALVSSLIPMGILVEFVSIGTLLAFTFVCISVLILRRTRPELRRPFRCPWVPFVPVTGALLCLLLMFSLPAANWYRLMAWFALGCIVYLLYGRKHGIGSAHQLMTSKQPPSAPATLGLVHLDNMRAHRAESEIAPSGPVQIHGRTSMLEAHPPASADAGALPPATQAEPAPPAPSSADQAPNRPRDLPAGLDVCTPSLVPGAWRTMSWPSPVDSASGGSVVQHSQSTPPRSVSMSSANIHQHHPQPSSRHVHFNLTPILSGPVHTPPTDPSSSPPRRAPGPATPLPAVGLQFCVGMDGSVRTMMGQARTDPEAKEVEASTSSVSSPPAPSSRPSRAQVDAARAALASRRASAAAQGGLHFVAGSLGGGDASTGASNLSLGRMDDAGQLQELAYDVGGYSYSYEVGSPETGGALTHILSYPDECNFTAQRTQLLEQLPRHPDAPPTQNLAAAPSAPVAEDGVEMASAERPRLHSRSSFS